MSSTFTVERKSDRKTYKPKAWSHQDDLKYMKGRTVDIYLTQGAVITGLLLDSDQFTLKIEHKDKSVMTYFKSGLVAFGLK